MRRRTPAGLWRDRAGVAGVEAALASGLVLVPLCLGMADYGMALADEARLDRALHAAVLYLFSNQTSYTAGGISTAANAGFGAASPTLTVKSVTACQCVTSGYSPVSTVACTGTCPSGQAVATYVTITLSYSFNLLVGIPNLATPLSEQVVGTVRTQ